MYMQPQHQSLMVSGVSPQVYKKSVVLKLTFALSRGLFSTV